MHSAIQTLIAADEALHKPLVTGKSSRLQGGEKQFLDARTLAA